MGPVHRRKADALAVSCLLFAGMLVSAAALSGAGASNATPAQLSTMILAAQGSRSYAEGILGAALLYGQNVTAEKAQVASGDGLLAQAEADLSSGTDLSGGIQAARAAMEDYTAAAVSSSVKLQRAGLTASVDVDAVADAVAEVNVTAMLVSGAVARGCETAIGSSSNASLFLQSCLQAREDIANATSSLGQAADLVAQVRAGASATVVLPQAEEFVAQARIHVKAAVSELGTVSSFTYVQRGESYYNLTLRTLYAAANDSVMAQQAANASLSGVQAAFGADARAQSSAVANASVLASAISGVDTLTVSGAASASESTAADVNSNLTSLLAALTGLTGAASLASAINAAQSSTTAYGNACSSAQAASSGYAAASLASFSGYLTGLQDDKSTVRSTGVTYVSDFTSVQVQLSNLIKTLGVLTPPALLTANSTLAGLKTRVAATTSSLNQALSAETASMSSVETGITATTTALDDPLVLVSSAVVQAAVSVVSEEATYLNQSSWAEVQSASNFLQADANSSASYVAQASTSLEGTVGGFNASASALASAGVSLKNSASAAASALARAASLVGGDLTARTNEVGAANAQVASAFGLLSRLDISAGVSAMVTAGVDFQAASATY